MRRMLWVVRRTYVHKHRDISVPDEILQYDQQYWKKYLNKSYPHILIATLSRNFNAQNPRLWLAHLGT